MMAIIQVVKLTFIQLVFFDQTAKLWIRGHQVFLDVLLLHHHRAPPIRIGNFGLRATVTHALTTVQSEIASSIM